MNQKTDTCHYCLGHEKDITINGQYRLDDGRFLCYRLCVSCAKKLTSINTFSDKKARQTFLTKVRENAEKDPTYK